MKNIVISMRCFFLLSLLTGVFYPIAVTFIGSVFFPAQVNGSLLRQDGVVVGSQLLAQKFTTARYFWPRPSAGDYATVASGASNLGPTSAALKALIDERRSLLGTGVPEDALLSSGSGLDPHISPEYARYQVNRVANGRTFSETQRMKLQHVVEEHIEERQLHVFGERRINVLKLNLEVDRLFP